MENDNSVEIEPTIKNGLVTELAVNRVKLPLHLAIPSKDLSDLIDAITNAAKYVDFGHLASQASESPEDATVAAWEPNDLEAFVVDDLKEEQIEALLVMTDGQERKHKPFLTALGKRLKKEVGSMKAGGLLSGISVKAKTKLHEPPHVIEEKIENGAWHRHYKLRRSEYAAPILQAAKKRGIA
jgi:hypothetical protein